MALAFGGPPASRHPEEGALMGLRNARAAAGDRPPSLRLPSIVPRAVHLRQQVPRSRTLPLSSGARLLSVPGQIAPGKAGVPDPRPSQIVRMELARVGASSRRGCQIGVHPRYAPAQAMLPQTCLITAEIRVARLAEEPPNAPRAPRTTRVIMIDLPPDRPVRSTVPRAVVAERTVVVLDSQDRVDPLDGKTEPLRLPYGRAAIGTEVAPVLPLVRVHPLIAYPAHPGIVVDPVQSTVHAVDVNPRH